MRRNNITDINNLKRTPHPLVLASSFQTQRRFDNNYIVQEMVEPFGSLVENQPLIHCKSNSFC